ncbi:hypothetical protein DRQ07_00990 [candidate division KSB1 bacterium]|nr:MAG: hypothetical protein DRQ07_00990 [candidate division KSB1 bacterium]
MNEIEKFKELKEAVTTISDKKIRIEERYKNLTEQLEKLIKEIKDKGYDPKKLNEIKTEKETALKKQLEELEIKVTEAQNKLDEIEE